MPPRCAIVLAGGRSARMGRDKAAIEIAGETLAARTVRVVSAVCERIVVVGAPGRPLPPLPPLSPEVSVAVVYDPAPFEGPLAGLAAGLAALADGTAAHALLVGVDLPRLGPEILAALLALAPDRRAVAMERPGGLLPFPSWIPVAEARARIEAQGAGRDRSLHGMLRALDVHLVTRASLIASSAPLAATDPDLVGLDDADDAAALAALLAR